MLQYRTHLFILINIFMENTDWYVGLVTTQTNLYVHPCITNVGIVSLRFLGIPVQSNHKWHIDKVASSIAKGFFLFRFLNGT